MMLTPVSVSPVESVGTVISEPRAVAIAPTDDDANHGRRNKEDRARRRWRWRRVVVTGRGRAVRLNHFGARIRPQRRSKAERKHRQYYYDRFFPHDRCPFVGCWPIEPNNHREVSKEREVEGL